ncbi:hypothetical protein NFI96_007773 [Prochilodus magdalenae]|nr:hypothetical protein NFI96_007773 [Prochilodus magdalenae]
MYVVEPKSIGSASSCCNQFKLFFLGLLVTGPGEESATVAYPPVSSQHNDAEALTEPYHIVSSTRNVYCNQQDIEYFSNRVVTTGQKLMVTSLVVNLIGLAVVAAGVRCWSNRPPDWTVTGVGGFLIFFSGILTLIPIGWFTHMLQDIKAPSIDIRVGYCIVLGYMGGLMKVIGGGAMFAGIPQCCDGLNRRTRHRNNTFGAVMAPRTIGNQSSMNQEGHPRDSAQEEATFPRSSGLVNTSYSYEADFAGEHIAFKSTEDGNSKRTKVVEYSTLDSFMY